jgi:hypothetical protein
MMSVQTEMMPCVRLTLAKGMSLPGVLYNHENTLSAPPSHPSELEIILTNSTQKPEHQQSSDMNQIQDKLRQDAKISQSNDGQSCQYCLADKSVQILTVHMNWIQGIAAIQGHTIQY